MAVNVNNPCLFCEFLKNKKIAAENDLAFAIFDGFPVNPGHVLVIPKRHVANYFELTSAEVLAINGLLNKKKAEVEAKFHPDGYNIGVNVGADAGQSIFHVHGGYLQFLLNQQIKRKLKLWCLECTYKS